MRALDNITLELKDGRSYALIGPNGSGKTTLIKSVLGLVVPTSGDIMFNGKKIAGDQSYRKLIGYMPQIGRYPENMRIGQLIEMMKEIRNHEGQLNESLLAEFGLYRIYDKRLHALSGGTRQKVSAALAFLFNAPVMILDEPTAGLDPVSVEILKEKILQEKQKGKLLIITSHILSDLDEFSSDAIYICDGKVQYNDTIANLKNETGENRLGRAIATIMSQKALIESING